MNKLHVFDRRMNQMDGFGEPTMMVSSGNRSMHAFLISVRKTARLFSSHHSSHPSPTTQSEKTVKYRLEPYPFIPKARNRIHINPYHTHQSQISMFPVSLPQTPSHPTSLQINALIEMQHTIRLNSTVDAFISIPSNKKTCICRIGCSMADITDEDQTSSLDSFDEAGCEIL